jgi:catechol 2,3-dioxygenase-like lactoylglutathione lyase family enzyme
MRLANGLNHLAINTKDIKAQIKFFTEVMVVSFARSIGCTGPARLFTALSGSAIPAPSRSFKVRKP